MLPSARALSETLIAAAAQYGVPGCVLAVASGGETVVAASGLASVAAGIEVTPDTTFLIGSITKPFTATLAMTLVDEGKLDLDAPLRAYLPEWSPKESHAPDAITIRHVLSHTSGIDGDVIIDTGRGDDCLARFVDASRGIALLHAPGEMFSYSNAAYVLLGRIIEKLTQKTWDEALKERVLAPLGLAHATTRPEEMLRHRRAVGHVGAPSAAQPTAARLLPRSSGPSGSRLAMTAADLLRFAALHLDEGSFDGKQIIGERSARLMRSRVIEIPQGFRHPAWGLGWARFSGAADAAFGHDGSVSGITSFLRIVPEKRFALAMFANGGNAVALFRNFAEPLLLEHAGINTTLPVPPAAPGLALDPANYVGRYERHGMGIEIAAKGNQLFGRGYGEHEGEGQPALALQPISADRFAADVTALNARVGLYVPKFDGEGRALYFHSAERVFKRVDA